MRILILGGTGFLGPQITARLLATGHEVTILHRGNASANAPAGVTIDRAHFDNEAEDKFLRHGLS